MELWVRSQDKKRLMKVNGLDYVEFGNAYIINGYGTNECDNYDIGIYETKERALEVLDAIQTLIEEYYDCLDNKIVLAPVYQMPEE